MEANVAVLLVLTVLALALTTAWGEIDLDRLSTTALGVLHSRTLLLARGTLLASRAVRHLVVEVKVGIVLGRDLELGRGETILLALAREGSGLLLAALVVDALAAKSALGEMVTLAVVASLALPAAAEVKVAVVAVAGRVAVVEVVPGVTALLLLGTLVVVVLRRLVVVGVAVPGGCDLLDSQPGDQKSNGCLHDDCDRTMSWERKTTVPSLC